MLHRLGSDEQTNGAPSARSRLSAPGAWKERARSFARPAQPQPARMRFSREERSKVRAENEANGASEQASELKGRTQCWAWVVAKRPNRPALAAHLPGRPASFVPISECSSCCFSAGGRVLPFDVPASPWRPPRRRRRAPAAPPRPLIPGLASASAARCSPRSTGSPPSRPPRPPPAPTSCWTTRPRRRPQWRP